MKLLSAMTMSLVITAIPLGLYAQETAKVEPAAKDVAIKAGTPIAFYVTLNDPLPEGARFDLRVSPTFANEEVTLGLVEPVGDSRQKFKVSGILPDGALPGEWHISVIYLFLPGASWTYNTISPGDVKFKVEGKSYTIPTKATITLAEGK